MWPFKRKKVWRSPRPKHRPPFGDFCVGEIVVRVWLNESFSNLDRTRTRWGFSFNRVIRGRYANSFRMSTRCDCVSSSGGMAVPRSGCATSPISNSQLGSCVNSWNAKTALRSIWKCSFAGTIERAAADHSDLGRPPGVTLSFAEHVASVTQGFECRRSAPRRDQKQGDKSPPR